ncbi:ABC transporter permease [Arthrobacter echini]|uniref:ABC transporter permease n=1 Tax=Arthrobacter echini TaxID=1529066 RepID=A0A5D0XUU3_9MICC|nr:ABC transporter permease [Arthrobacter echini]TYD00504.1 ABC transporter permease [Arthrobacter echini]
MATSTQPVPAERRSQRPRTSGPGVTFGRVLKSEWIKVTTVPSTVILIISTVVVMVGLAALFAWSQSISAEALSDPDFPAEFQAPAEGPGSPGFAALSVPSSGLIFGQLLIAALAVVLIASEWTTGMIRSTMVAVPKRTPALLAKTLVVAVVAFAVGLGSALISYLVAQPILRGEDIDFAITEDGVFQSILNTGTFLALVAIISMAIGILLRNTAGGVVTAVGIFFVLPLIVQLLSGLADWIPKAARFLPGDAGNQMVSITTLEDDLTQWEGGLVMGAWALGLLLVALLVAKKRDV